MLITGKVFSKDFHHKLAGVSYAMSFLHLQLYQWAKLVPLFWWVDTPHWKWQTFPGKKKVCRKAKKCRTHAVHSFIPVFPKLFCILPCLFNQALVFFYFSVKQVLQGSIKSLYFSYYILWHKIDYVEASVSLFFSAILQKLSLEKFHCGKSVSLTHLVKLPVHLSVRSERKKESK